MLEHLVYSGYNAVVVIDVGSNAVPVYRFRHLEKSATSDVGSTLPCMPFSWNGTDIQMAKQLAVKPILYTGLRRSFECACPLTIPATHWRPSLHSYRGPQPSNYTLKCTMPVSVLFRIWLGGPKWWTICGSGPLPLLPDIFINYHAIRIWTYSNYMHWYQNSEKKFLRKDADWVERRVSLSHGRFFATRVIVPQLRSHLPVLYGRTISDIIGSIESSRPALRFMFGIVPVGPWSWARDSTRGTQVQEHTTFWQRDFVTSTAI